MIRISLAPSIYRASNYRWKPAYHRDIDRGLQLSYYPMKALHFVQFIIAIDAILLVLAMPIMSSLSLR